MSDFLAAAVGRRRRRAVSDWPWINATRAFHFGDPARSGDDILWQWFAAVRTSSISSGWDCLEKSLVAPWADQRRMFTVQHHPVSERVSNDDVFGIEAVASQVGRD